MEGRHIQLLQEEEMAFTPYWCTYVAIWLVQASLGSDGGDVFSISKMRYTLLLRDYVQHWIIVKELECCLLDSS